MAKGCPLATEALDRAERDLASRNLASEWLTKLANNLEVACVPSQPGFHRAVAGALAVFELRTLPFTTEVDGILDDRTRRFLAMFHPSLRDEGHPCRSARREPPPQLLTAAQLDAAKDKNGKRAGKSEAWVRVLQASLGAGDTTGELDALTLQRIAGWQRTLQVVNPAVRIDGVIDATTSGALQRAFPRLMSSAPDPHDDEGYLPACVASWKGADEQERAFMMQVYETQRVWAAQRRDFVGLVPDAAPIEDGRTARSDAARAAQRMLVAARASVADPKSRNHGGDLQVVFGYRSAAVQVAIWEFHFPDRYKLTAVRRTQLPDGPHGHGAVIDMAKYYSARTAAPGYSLHNRGLALDLACITPRRRTVGPTGRFLREWQRSWCYSWLEKHAERFGFRQNATINEPWHWEYRDR
jgi:D-alanyl-D-alanine carboxypeptidase